MTEQKKEKHTLRNVVIVIAVILAIGIIGSSTDSSDDKETEFVTEAFTEVMTEAETESELTVEEALQAYVDRNTDGWGSKPETINREDLTAYLAEGYSEEEAEVAIANADIDWKTFAVEYENSLLKDKEVYHEEDLREELALKAFTQDEIDYALENVNWTLQKDILDFIDEYRYGGIEEDPNNSSKTYMFWTVMLTDGSDSSWWSDTDFIELAVSCMQQPETQANAVDGYGITVYDGDGQAIYVWSSYDDGYTITQFVWRSNETNPERYEWGLTTDGYNEIMDAGNVN